MKKILFLISIIAMILLVPVVSSQTANNELFNLTLILNYPFETHGSNNASLDNREGIVTGDVQLVNTSFGVPPSSLFFDGNSDIINFTNQGFYETARNMTFCFSANATSGLNAPQIAFGTGILPLSVGDITMVFSFDTRAGQNKIVISISEEPSPFARFISPTNFLEGYGGHFQRHCAMFNATSNLFSVSYFLNGTQIPPSNFIEDTLSGGINNDFHIGAQQRQLGTFTDYLGGIDDFTFYNDSLNDKQMALDNELFQNGIILQFTTVDSTPPTIISTVINNTTPDFFEIILFNVTATDDTELNRIEIADNRTGAFSNFTFVTVSGTSITSLFNISAQVGTIQLQATVTDLEGNSAQSDLIILAVKGNQLRGNETGDLTNWTGGVTSEEGNYVVDANNEFGQYTKKLVGDVVKNTNNWSVLLDVAVDLTAGADKRIAEFWLDNTTHVDDTNLSFTIEILSNNSVQIINAQDPTQNSIIEGLTDDGVFRQVSIVFLENQVQILNSTGELRANISLTAGFTDIISMNFGSQSEISPNVRWDNFTIINGSQLIAGVARQVLNIYTSSGDTQAPTIILVDPSSNVNNTRNNTIPLEITFQVTDDSFNSIICNLENSTILDTGTFIQGVDSNLTLAEGEIVLDQDFPNLAIVCFDNTALNNSASLLLNITLDTVPPIIFTIFPANEEKFNRDIFDLINIKANCTDSPVFRFNITVENATDRIASFESRNSVNNFIIIDEQLSIANLGVGNYTINYTCADPHTRERIADYNIKTNSTDYRIRYITPDKNDFTIRYLQNSLPIETFGSSKTEVGDRYRFWFNTNVTETRTTRTFIFEILSRKPVHYIPNSKFDAHFITGNNWIDFELDDEDAKYLVTKNAQDNWEVEVTTLKTKLNFQSVGDLNVFATSTTFEVFFVEQITDFFVVTVCQTDTGSVLLLILFFALSLFFIWLGLTANIGFIGFFGATMMMILSWFIAACIAIFALIMALLSLVLIIFFVIGFIGFKNRTYIP